MSKTLCESNCEWLKDLDAIVEDMKLHPEREAALEAARAAAEERQRLADIEFKLRRLSPRHVEYARALEAGEHDPSPAWLALSATLQKAPGSSVLLCGPSGTGKTTAATRWAYRQVHATGRSALHVPAAKFSVLVKHEDAMVEAERARVLILDQLHRLRELPSWISTPILELIDHRYEHRDQTIGCFQGSLLEATADLKIAVVERLGTALEVTGASYRRTW